MNKLLLIVYSFVFTYVVHGQSSGKLTISGVGGANSSIHPVKPDSLILLVWDRFYEVAPHWNVPHRRFAVKYPGNGGKFTFQIEIGNEPVYFSLSSLRKSDATLMPILALYLGEPGDSITIINLNTPDMKFYGRGSQKYNCRYELDRFTLFYRYSPFLSPDSAGQMTILNSYKCGLSPDVYQIMRGDILGQYELSTSRSKIFAKYGVGAYGKAIDTVNNEYINVEYSDQEVQEFMKLLPSKEFITEGATQFTRSRFFQHACFQREVLLKKFTNKSLDELYHSLKSNYSGELRDRIITTFFYENGIDAINADSLMSDALTVINNDKDKSILMMLGDKLLKGRPARNFSLPDTSGRMVSLSDFRGKVVFIDFWFTGCMACREYYVEDIAKAKEEFRESDDVVFLSVNVDNTRERWMKSVNDTVHRYTSPDIINLHTGGVGLHHPVIKDYNVRGYPAPILIDAEGKIFCASHYELRSRDGRKLIKTIYAALNK